MATVVPNVNLSTTNPAQLVSQLNQNFQAIDAALAERLVAQRVTVPRYAATGGTTTKMTLGIVSSPGSTPWAVILVRAQETSDPAKDLAVSTRVNFSQQGTAQTGVTLNVYEPAGLTADTLYDLSFLVIFDG